jgi:hypothetical protein
LFIIFKTYVQEKIGLDNSDRAGYSY